MVQKGYKHFNLLLQMVVQLLGPFHDGIRSIVAPPSHSALWSLATVESYN